MYADDLVLLSPSAKWLQRLVDICAAWLHPISPKVRKFEGSRVRRFFCPKVRKLEKKRFWSPNEKVL